LKFEIFPNPSNEFININTNGSGSFKLNVCSIIGKSEITRAIDFSGNNEFEIDIS
jgi:hypothetical protein